MNRKMETSTDPAVAGRHLRHTLNDFLSRPKVKLGRATHLFQLIGQVQIEELRVRYFRQLVRGLDTPAKTGGSSPTLNHCLGFWGVLLRSRAHSSALPEAFGRKLQVGLHKHLEGLQDPHWPVPLSVVPVNFASMNGAAVVALLQEVSRRHGANPVCIEAPTDEGDYSGAWGFVFACAVPGSRFEVAAEAEFPATPHAQAVWARLQRRIEEINRLAPELALELGKPVRFSEAFLMANRQVVKDTVRRFVEQHADQAEGGKNVEVVHRNISKGGGQRCEVRLRGESAENAARIYFDQANLWRNAELESLLKLAMTRRSLPDKGPVAQAASGARSGEAASNQPVAVQEVEVANVEYGALEKTDANQIERVAEARPVVQKDESTSITLSESLHDHFKPLLDALKTRYGAESVDLLPSPVLYDSLDVKAAFSKHYRRDIAAQVEALVKQGGATAAQGYQQLVLSSEEFARLRAQPDGDYRTHWPEAFVALRFLHRAGTLFCVRDALVKGLELTDLEDELDASFFQLPFPECYFDFGSAVSAAACLVAGMYFSSVTTPVAKGARRIEVAVVLARNGKTDYRELVELGVEVGSAGTLNFGSLLNAKVRDGTLATADRPMVERALLLGQKILLYAGLRNARKVTRQGFVDADTFPADVPGADPRSRRAVERFEYVEIGPDKLANDNALQGMSRGSGMHWRRGHFRMQRYGQGLELRRRIWIMPVLVLPGGEEGLVQQDIRKYLVS